MKNRKIILFELNEVPFRIIDEYCKLRPNSCFAKHLPECQQFETYTNDSVLSPWITWPTLHRGVPDTYHTISHLGQDLTEVDLKYPPIWEFLASRGVKVGVFGSLHSYPLPTSIENYSFYIPDTFAAGSECLPEKYSIFQDINLSMTRKSTRNVSNEIPWRKVIQLLVNIPSFGLTIKTLEDISKQLLSERFKPWRTCRRRTCQSILSFDLFYHQLTNNKPDFVTFFTNHVASSMHRYWPALFPNDYELFGYDKQWISKYKNEILYSMDKFNFFFEKLVKFVVKNPEYEVWIASSMGQSATKAEPVTSQLYLVDIHRFMEVVGIPPGAWTKRQAMVPDYSFFVKDKWAEKFREKISQLFIEGRPLSFDEKENGFFHLTLGHYNLIQKHITHAVLQGEEYSFESLGFANTYIEDESGSGAYHISKGSLLIFDPKSQTKDFDRKRISTLDIVPEILNNFSIDIPDYMSCHSNLFG